MPASSIDPAPDTNCFAWQIIAGLVKMVSRPLPAPLARNAVVGIHSFTVEEKGRVYLRSMVRGSLSECSVLLGLNDASYMYLRTCVAMDRIYKQSEPCWEDCCYTPKPTRTARPETAGRRAPSLPKSRTVL